MVSSTFVRGELGESQSAPLIYLEAAYAADRTPNVVVTPDLQVIRFNTAAGRMFEAGEDLFIRNDRLTVLDRNQAADLQAFVATVTETASVWLYRCPSGDCGVILRGQRVTPPGWESAVSLDIYKTSDHARYVWADFRSFFGLTEAETRLLKLLIAGNGVEKLAAELSISVETARTHLRRAYAKVNVSNREELFAALLPFRVG